MNVICYLRVSAQRNTFTGDIKHPNYFKAVDLKVSKNKPDTYANEISIKLDLAIPNSLFVKPTLNFKMSIPEDAVSLPVLEAEVQDNLAVLLAEELGQRVHLSISSDELEG